MSIPDRKADQTHEAPDLSRAYLQMCAFGKGPMPHISQTR